MFHFQQSIQNTKGDALIGFYVKVMDRTTGDVVPIYADENSTPIISVSGVENACEVDSDGMADFYVADGQYDLNVYATDHTTFVHAYHGVPMSTNGVLLASSVADLATKGTSYLVALTADGQEGLFLFKSEDLSAQVTADPSQSTYVAPASDDTGASGAWVRMSNNNGTATNSNETGVIGGLGIAYDSGLTFKMAAGTYSINGVTYSAAEQSVTLDAGDATNSRIDVLYVDIDGVFGKITGTPAAAPSQPSVASGQLFLSFVLVPAGASSLSGITLENIYLENAEWTTSTSVTTGTIAVASTNAPYAGTKSIEGGAYGGEYVKLVRGSPISFGGDGSLNLYVRPKSAWSANAWLALQFYASGVAQGSQVPIWSATAGFDPSQTVYQLVSINKTAFAIAPDVAVDELRIVVVGPDGLGVNFYIDNIVLQTNGTTTSPVTWSTFTQAQADARYVKLTGGTMVGDLIVPAEAYGVAWNGSNEVPTKNDVYDKIEAVVAGSGTTFASTAEVRAGTVSTKAIAPDTLQSAVAPQTLTDGATVTWNMSTAINAKVTLGGNRTLSVSNPTAGATYSLGVIQDGTGSRTLTWPASFDWGTAGAPTLTTTASKRDRVTVFCTDAATPKFDAFLSGKGFA